MSLSYHRQNFLFNIIRIKKNVCHIRIYPRLIHSINLPGLLAKLYTEQANRIVSNHSTDYYILFVLKNDETGNITRAIQEDEILKTKFKLKKTIKS